MNRLLQSPFTHRNQLVSKSFRPPTAMASIKFPYNYLFLFALPSSWNMNILQRTYSCFVWDFLIAKCGESVIFSIKRILNKNFLQHRETLRTYLISPSKYKVCVQADEKQGKNMHLQIIYKYLSMPTESVQLRIFHLFACRAHSAWFAHLIVTVSVWFFIYHVIRLKQ